MWKRRKYFWVCKGGVGGVLEGIRRGVKLLTRTRVVKGGGGGVGCVRQGGGTSRGEGVLRVSR